MTDAPAARRGLGYVLIEKRRLDESETAYREALALDPSNELAQGGLLHITKLWADVSAKSQAR